jgi:hypothetical protein
MLVALLAAVRALSFASTGLFMSAASANASGTALEEYLRAAAFACTSPWNVSTSTQYVSSVAIQSVGDGEGGGKLYGTALNRMIPALRCIPQMYVGTTIPRSRDFYCGDVLNSTFTARAIQSSAAAARAFVERYGATLEFAWYIAPEQFLNHFAEGCTPKSDAAARITASALAAAWGAFLREWTEALAAVRPRTRILWSPAAPESPVRGSNTSAAYAATLRASLRTIAASAPLLTDIAIQDSVGKASNASTVGTIEYPVGCVDAAWHANISKAAFAAPAAAGSTDAAGSAAGPAAGSAAGTVLNVTTVVNMELFLRKGRRSPASAIIDIPGDPLELRRRAVCYEAHELAVGPSWEARYWLRDLTEVWQQ